MKEGNWEECIETLAARKVSIDADKASSLWQTAMSRIEYLAGAKVDKKNANFIFEGYYSSMLELLHSLMHKEGFKVQNHICLGYYVRDVLKKDSLFRIFEDLRYKRNSLLYYGKMMDYDVARDAIERCKNLIKEIGGY